MGMGGGGITRGKMPSECEKGMRGGKGAGKKAMAVKGKKKAATKPPWMK